MSRNNLQHNNGGGRRTMPSARQHGGPAQGGAEGGRGSFSASAEKRSLRDQGRYARASAARRRKRHRRAAAAVAAVLVVACIGVAGAFALNGGLFPFSGAEGSGQQDAAGSQAAGDDQAQDTGAGSDAQQGGGAADDSDNGSADGSGDAGDAAANWDPSADPRNQDFAVDPDNKTEWRTKTDGTKTIWLTFDDGPSALTQQVLDILNQYGVKATFFVTNEEPQYAYMIKEAYAEGNTIGLHSYTHDYATVYASEDAFFDDLDKIGAVVKDQIGYVPCFIRFPGGSSNSVSAHYTKGIMTALTADVQARGYQYFDWNISCGDGAAGHTAEELAGYACDGDDYTNIVLLMHDSAGHENTVAALPTIIEHYQNLGYTFKAIDRSALASHHGLNN